MTDPLQLTGEQVNSFNDFLLDGTAHTLSALETVFELSIDCSDSSIEIAPTADNKNLQHFGSGSLYIISSSLTGEVDGSIVLLMRSRDFHHLSEMMRPVLSLLYLSSSDADMTVLEHDKPEWMQNDGADHTDDAAFREQMMDALAEMGNVLIGLYTRSIYRICGLNTHHSVPLVMKDPQQSTIRRILYSSKDRECLHLVIENELFLKNKPLKLWCLISPTQESFQKILQSIDSRALSANEQLTSH